MTINKLISSGQMNSFQEIFDTLPKSVVARDLRMNNVRFSRLMNNVDLFLVRDIFRFAALLEVDDMVLLNLVYQTYKTDKNDKK